MGRRWVVLLAVALLAAGCAGSGARRDEGGRLAVVATTTQVADLAVFSETTLPPRAAETIGREAGVRVVTGEDASTATRSARPAPTATPTSR